MSTKFFAMFNRKETATGNCLIDVAIVYYSRHQLDIGRQRFVGTLQQDLHEKP